MKYLFPTIAYQIVRSARDARVDRKIEKLLEDDPYLPSRSGGPIQLIVEPVQFLTASSTSSIPFLVIIDGLDDCQGNDAQSLVLKNILDLIHQHHLPLKFLIISRPEPHIEHIFSADPAMVKVSQPLSLYGGFGALDDICNFLASEFDRIANSERHKAMMEFVPRPWPSNKVIQELAQRSGGYFLYVSTVIKYIDKEYVSCVDQLDQVLESSPAAFAELDNLYTQILSSCPDAALLKPILGFVVFTTFSPTVSQIEVILNLPQGEVLVRLRGMHSLFAFHGPSWNCTIVSVHPSFADFIRDAGRSGMYHVDISDWYVEALRGILRATSNLHKRKIRYVYLVYNFSISRCVWHELSSESLVPFLNSLSFEARAYDKGLWVRTIEESIKADPWIACIAASEHFPDSDKLQVVNLLATLVKEILPVRFLINLTS